jgi:hypothetical protein
VTRIVSVLNAAALAERDVRLFVAVAMDFTSGAVYAHDGVGPITFGGHTYDGIGTFGGIEIAEESLEVIAKPITLTLSGVDASNIGTSLDASEYQGRNVILYLGVQSLATNAVIDTPETLWEGRMDQMSVSLKPKEASITLRCEHRLRREPLIARYTDVDQKLKYSGDRFFDLVPKIAGYRGKWGALPTGQEILDDLLRRVRG